MPWFFQPVVNACIQIMICIAAGSCLSHLRIVNSSHFVPQTSALVLYLSFPCLNVFYLGIETDLTNREDWLVLSASICWTVIVQIIIVIAVLFFTPSLLKSFGTDETDRHDLLTARIRCAGLLNLYLTSDNTVLVGLPLATAAFGSTGAKCSLLTMFAIFLLAIPFSIVCFEWERARTCNATEGRDLEDISQVNVPDRSPQIHPSAEASISAEASLSITSSARFLAIEPPADKRLPAFAIARKVLSNPLLWSLCLAIIVSVSKVGPKYLNPSSSSYIAELGWIASTCRTLASVAVPLSLVSQGAWMWTKPLSLGGGGSQTGPLVFILVTRSIILPLLMLVVVRYIVGLDPKSGMSLVLLSVCPLASSCFVVAVEYSRGQTMVTTLTITGTALLLPLSLMILYLPRALGVWDYQIDYRALKDVFLR